jgi:periplasmic divalent cation tolerance protein
VARTIVVFVTASSRKEGEKIGRALIAEKLAACVNIVAPITSIFTWQGKLCREREALLVIKTRRALFSRLASRVKSLHSYQVPEIIALPIEAGWPDYLKWLAQETRM